MYEQIVIAGFGGQGVLFAGKILAYMGMDTGKELSWLPSYGPEMRGGTCNCSVIIADSQIGSPIIQRPDALIVMNKPSLEKFVDTVKPGGVIVLDSSLIDTKVERGDEDSRERGRGNIGQHGNGGRVYEGEGGHV